MASCSVTISIDAPQSRVFEVFADLESAPTRVRGIKKLELLTPGPVGKGTRFRETRVMMGKEATEVMEVMSFDAPRSYEVEANSCGCRYFSRLEFAPSGSSTNVTMTFSATPLTFFAKLMSPLGALMMKSCRAAMQRDFDDLKAAIEGRPPAAAVTA